LAAAGLDAVDCGDGAGRAACGGEVEPGDVRGGWCRRVLNDYTHKSDSQWAGLGEVEDGSLGRVEEVVTGALEGAAPTLEVVAVVGGEGLSESLGTQAGEGAGVIHSSTGGIIENSNGADGDGCASGAVGAGVILYAAADDDGGKGAGRCWEGGCWLSEAGDGSRVTCPWWSGLAAGVWRRECRGGHEEGCQDGGIHCG
jgi:hypothetical protein